MHTTTRNEAVPQILNEAALQPMESWASPEPRVDQPMDESAQTDYHKAPREPRSLRHILAAADFSPASFKAIDQAVALANQCGAQLTVLHVIDTNAQSDTEDAETLMRRLWDEGSSQMAQLGVSLCGQVEARTMVEQGLAWETLIEKSKDYDLLVLGKSSAVKRSKVFSQRTVERVVQNASCPVMVVG